MDRLQRHLLSPPLPVHQSSRLAPFGSAAAALCRHVAVVRCLPLISHSLRNLESHNGLHVTPPRAPCSFEQRHVWEQTQTEIKALFRPGEPYNVSKRPSFGQWLKFTILDLLTMAVLGAITWTVFRAGPAAKRTFPLTVTDTGEVVYPQFAYPYRPQFIPSWLASVFAITIPIAFFLLAQIRIRSFWDLNNAIIGLIYSLEVSTCFQVFVKWLVGGLRPHFYDVCRPDPSLATGGSQHNSTGLNGVGYQSYMYTDEICTSGNQDGIDNALEGFPSGHTTSMFAGMVFLYLYLNAKLKVYSNYHPAMWKLVLLYCPILGACLVGGSLTVDQSHNWYDVMGGAVIGIVFAFSAYRSVYAAIWDFRYNHIPLNRAVAFSWREGVEGSDMVFTKRVGWRAGYLGNKASRPAVTGSDPTLAEGGHLGLGATTWYSHGRGLAEEIERPGQARLARFRALNPRRIKLIICFLYASRSVAYAGQQCPCSSP